MDIIDENDKRFRYCNAKSLSAEEMVRVETEYEEYISQSNGIIPRQALVIPTYFHVIHDGNVGRLTRNDVEVQMDVLNEAYASSQSRFQFNLIETTYTNNREWFEADANSNAEQELLDALHRGNCATFNIYTLRAQGYYGSAFMPSQIDCDDRNDYIYDGVWINYGTIPGGSAGSNNGLTLVHEAGHWLGLYHTFQGGCAPPGDYVDDTPPQARATRGCPSGSPDTCGDGTPDLFENVMDYASDQCIIDEFTPGQVERMGAQWNIYRDRYYDGGGGGVDDDGVDDDGVDDNVDDTLEDDEDDDDPPATFPPIFSGSPISIEVEEFFRVMGILAQVFVEAFRNFNNG